MLVPGPMGPWSYATGKGQGMARARAPQKPKVRVNENGLSVVGPFGRMTHPLLTRYQIGDRVLLTHNAEDLADQDAAPGETGVIRRIGVCDPNDGDTTALNFNVALDDGGEIDAAEYELAPFAAVEAWLGRNLAKQVVAPGIRRFVRASA
jgi:hypothetical protein